MLTSHIRGSKSIPKSCLHSMPWFWYEVCIISKLYNGCGKDLCIGGNVSWGGWKQFWRLEVLGLELGVFTRGFNYVLQGN